jgi:hypothetical protein
MTGPIARVQVDAAQALTDAAARLGVVGVAAQPNAIRFRPDGKGGELASPYPRICGLTSAALAHQLTCDSWWAHVYPSGDWIGFDLSPRWDALVRGWSESTPALSYAIPPLPAFPAKIRREDWALCALLGKADPCIAARLDRGNPAQNIRRAQLLAGQNRGGNAPDRALVNQAALVYQALYSGNPGNVARAMLALAQRYLAQSGEDALVGRSLAAGAGALQL